MADDDKTRPDSGGSGSEDAGLTSNGAEDIFVMKSEAEMRTGPGIEFEDIGDLPYEGRDEFTGEIDFDPGESAQRTGPGIEFEDIGDVPYAGLDDDCVVDVANDDVLNLRRAPEGGSDGGSPPASGVRGIGGPAGDPILIPRAEGGGGGHPGAPAPLPRRVRPMNDENSYLAIIVGVVIAAAVVVGGFLLLRSGGGAANTPSGAGTATTAGGAATVAAGPDTAACLQHDEFRTVEEFGVFLQDQGFNVIFGEDSDDELVGTGMADAIFALAGNDVIRGEGGPDCLFGGDGSDFIFGGPGADAVFGERGDDWLDSGGDPGDYEDGGEGADQCTLLDGEAGGCEAAIAASTSSTTEAPDTTLSPTTTSTEPPTTTIAAWDGGDTTAKVAAVEPFSLYANLTDVRFAQREEGFTRVVFDFEGDVVPWWTVEYQEGPFFAAGDDPNPVDVAGTHFLSVTFAGSGVDLIGPEFRITYEGPDRLEAGTNSVVEIVLIEDFEGVSQWVIGLDGVKAFEVGELTDHPRVYVDIAD